MTWKNAANQPPQSIRINSIQQYVTPDSSPTSSPLDAFYDYSQDLLRAGDVEALQNHPYLGGLLLVGLVSATENYFRDILSKIIISCPISQTKASEESISLGSVIWHEPSNALRGAFEHFSFASSKNIINTCSKFTDIKLNNCQAILSEFDKICELRHGIAHAGACVPGKNAIKLQIPSHNSTIRIRLGFPELQEAGAICTNVVTSINLELFEAIARRWADDWRKLPSWDNTNEEILFEKIWNLFHSTNDESKGLIANPMNKEQCLNAIRQEYNL